MPNRDIGPHKGAKRPLPAKQEITHPLLTLQREMNRVFDNFFSGFDPFPDNAWERGLQAYNPRVDVTDDAKALHVTVELPGMEEKDIDVSVTHDALTIQGQKNQETEDRGKNYYRMERSYGAFQRVIPLPASIDASRVEATFKKGILAITLPKTGRPGRSTQKIAVKSAS